MTDYTKTDEAWTEISGAYNQGSISFLQNASATFTSHGTYLATMMNRIGLTRCYGVDQFTGPFGKYDRGVIDYGDTVQTYKTKKINPTAYDPDDATSPFATAKNPPIAEYETINVAKKYKVTITEEQIAKAFTSEQKLGDFVANQLATLQEADQIDVYTEWKKYVSSTAKFISEVFTPGTDDIYETIRRIAMDFRAPSKDYNKAGDLAVTTGPIDVILTKERYREIGTKLGGVYHPDYIALGDVNITWIDDFATTPSAPAKTVHALICDSRALNRWVRTPKTWSILNSETGAMNYVYKLESIYAIDSFRNAKILYTDIEE